MDLDRGLYQIPCLKISLIKTHFCDDQPTTLTISNINNFQNGRDNGKIQDKIYQSENGRRHKRSAEARDAGFLR